MCNKCIIAAGIIWKAIQFPSSADVKKKAKIEIDSSAVEIFQHSGALMNLHNMMESFVKVFGIRYQFI